MSVLSRSGVLASSTATNRPRAFDTNLNRRPDYWILAAVISLCLVGLVMVYSASYAEALAADPSNPALFALKHLQSLLTGAVLLVIFTAVPYPFWRRISVPAMGLTLLLLVLVLIAPAAISPDINGAHRWIQLGPFSMQPSELCKLVLVLYIADWLSQKGQKVRDLTYGLIPFGVVMGMIAFLVLREPDMGTTLVLIAIGVAIFFIAGAHMIHFLASTVMGGFVFYLLMFTASYRSNRFATFIDPDSDPLGAGYHISQSRMALGSGGLFGLGLGAGRQKFGWLPEQFTDTIFAVLGQEWGFIGAVLLLVLFGLLIFRGTRTALRARDSYGTLLATGITAWIGVQALINIGSVCGAIPFTGITLPFISYGGSSLAVTMAGVGLLLNISRYQVTPRRKIPGPAGAAGPLPPLRRRWRDRFRRARAGGGAAPKEARL
ncbi:MAG TPA: putative lipid II flippase FtsW [Chloroflexia bacterium]|nr:putative lipid II flippase FtsW [Chloroflexia bacterium]